MHPPPVPSLIDAADNLRKALAPLSFPDPVAYTRRKTGISYVRLAEKIGVCADTLVNLKNRRYQPTRQTYKLLKEFSSVLTAHKRQREKRQKK